MRYYSFFLLLGLAACTGPVDQGRLMHTDSLQAMADTVKVKDSLHIMDSLAMDARKKDSARVDQTRNKDSLPLIPTRDINTGKVNPNDLVAFARTLKGTPYVYASADPKRGFDCSGFITYVFNHFRIAVPRSSVDFTHVGKEVSTAQARKGDLILFTGTNPEERMVGHMGIVVSNADTLRFIHSTSGKAMSVTETPLNKYYLGRFVKVIRVFPE